MSSNDAEFAELRALLHELIATVRDGDATTREVVGKVAALIDAISRRAESDGALRRTFTETISTLEEVDREQLHELTKHGLALARIEQLLAPKPKDPHLALRIARAVLSASPRTLLAIGISSVLVGAGAGVGYAVYKIVMHAACDLP